MAKEMIGFKNNGSLRSLKLESLLLSLFEANIDVVNSTVTEYKPQFGSVGELQCYYASKAVIICDVKSKKDSEEIDKLLKLM